mmetsp:Transcript_65132/g.155525  ORF Transcript_65132/g.155525 Transcript_65132/m.155525 type:complete len:118 (-) Transcript_65132:68-421(-)
MDPLGARPVLLNNPNGWTNITRFTTLMANKLSQLERKNLNGSMVALRRTLSKIEQQRLREAFMTLQSNASRGKFTTMKEKAEAQLLQLSSLVEAFDMDVDSLVEEIVAGELAREEVQ